MTGTAIAPASATKTVVVSVFDMLAPTIFSLGRDFR